MLQRPNGRPNGLGGRGRPDHDLSAAVSQGFPPIVGISGGVDCRRQVVTSSRLRQRRTPITDKEDQLEGAVERITYRADDTGFTIARLQAKGSYGKPGTVVGAMAVNRIAKGARPYLESVSSSTQPSPAHHGAS